MKNADESKLNSIEYIFKLPHGSVRKYSIQMDSFGLKSNRIQEVPPHWADLSFQQCKNCPLKQQSTPFCPVAVNLVELVTLCNDLDSYDELNVEVRTPERIIITDTTVQRALSSLLGLVIPSSACPHTRYFRPMAHFHLPFSSEEETMYRATSMYLLAQYFLKLEGRRVNFDLQGLTKIYQNIQVVNSAMAKRLRAASKKDGTINAIILLDLFAKSLPYSIDESLHELKYLFQPYWDISDG